MAPEQKIQVYRLDPKDGKLIAVEAIAVQGAPGALAVDPQKKFLFATLRSTDTIESLRVEKRLPPPFDHRSIIEVVLVDQLGRCREEIILLLVRVRSCLALIKPRRRLLLVRFVRRA